MFSFTLTNVKQKEERMRVKEGGTEGGRKEEKKFDSSVNETTRTHIILYYISA